jgi:hypothetical protein
VLITRTLKINFLSHLIFWFLGKNSKECGIVLTSGLELNSFLNAYWEKVGLKNK